MREAIATRLAIDDDADGGEDLRMTASNAVVVTNSSPPTMWWIDKSALTSATDQLRAYELHHQTEQLYDKMSATQNSRHLSAPQAGGT